MKLSHWYDFYFKNKGRCPECGHWLVPHIGCVGWTESPPKKRCLICKLAYKENNKKNFIANSMRAYRGMLAHRRKFKKQYGKRNLDIQGKKTYFKVND